MQDVCAYRRHFFQLVHAHLLTPLFFSSLMDTYMPAALLESITPPATTPILL